MKKGSIAGVLLIILLWQFAAFRVDNDILIPYPADVLKQLLEIIQSRAFYESVIHTVFRVAKGFGISMICALIFSVLSDRYPLFRQLFAPAQLLTRTIPNASYIILAIIWLGAEGSVAAVTFMILFPLFYNSFINALDNEPSVLKDVDSLYQHSMRDRLLYRTMPLLTGEILDTGRTAASMGLKVGVMAEILGAVRIGIGRQLSLSRTYLETDRLLAWTVIIIVISLLFDRLFRLLSVIRMKEEKRWRN